MPTFYANPDPLFFPAMRLISAITQAAQASVTTTFDHDYLTGLIVRLDVPQEYGMQEVNQKVGTIVVTSSTTFTIDIDTRTFQAFSIPGSPTQAAQVVPIGEDNSTVYLATRNLLP
jgi:hypothetical protein